MDFSEITSTVSEMNTQMAKIENEFREKMQALFTNAAKTFFVECPDVKAIAWNQYTPYFNDGEECVFNVNEVHFYGGNDNFDIRNYDLQALSYEDLDPTDEIEEDDGAWYISTSSWRGGNAESIEKLGQKQYDSIIAMQSIIAGNEDIMRALFGDHTLVAITKDETITEEFEHD
jgi:hypothetical protein